MNRKTIFAAAAILIAVAVMLFIRPGKDAGESEVPTVAKPERVPRSVPFQPAPNVSQDRKAALSNWDLPKARVSPHALQSEEHRIWIEEQVADLMDQSWFFDEPEVLRKVMADLRSPEPELRKAALEAVVNLGSRDAIPYLESAAALAESPEESKALIDAAEYLKLPTILEVRDRD